MHRFLRWKDPLLDARTVGDVRRVMNDYLATLRAGDFEALPATCWDVLTVDDIAGSALILTRAELTFMGSPEVAAVLHEIAQTYVAASNRLVQIQGRGEPVAGNNIP